MRSGRAGRVDGHVQGAGMDLQGETAAGTDATAAARDRRPAVARIGNDDAGQVTAGVGDSDRRAGLCLIPGHGPPLSVPNSNHPWVAPVVGISPLLGGPGLSRLGRRGTAGELAGTPATAGTYVITMRLSDHDGRQATQQYTVSIQP
jgi:hypothetical protein